MSDLLPDRVDTSNIVALRDQADAVVEWAASATDPIALWANRRQATALERYVEDRETKARLMRAAAWTTAHLGRVLGPGPGPGRPSENSPTVGEFPGIPPQRQSEARRLRRWALDLGDVDIVRACDRGTSVAVLMRMIAERTPVESDELDGELELDDVWRDVADGEGWRLIGGDFRDVADTMPDESVDLIVTDPPYPTDHLPLYSDLAEVAARLLRPRGLLFVVTGQLHLPEILRRLGEHMTYGWTFRLDLPGTNSRIMGRHLIQTWKPVLAYSTGTWPSGEWRTDRLVGTGKDQDDEAWGQDVAPAVDLISSYSRPNALVFDPFTGGGAYGQAAFTAGRRFIGTELDGHRYESARRRIARTVA